MDGPRGGTVDDLDVRKGGEEGRVGRRKGRERTGREGRGDRTKGRV